VLPEVAILEYQDTRPDCFKPFRFPVTAVYAVPDDYQVVRIRIEKLVDNPVPILLKS
jgi:hypothetical protein